MRYGDVHSESCSVAVQIYPLLEVAMPEPHRLRIDRHLTAHIYIPAHRCCREKMCVALTILLDAWHPHAIAADLQRAGQNGHPRMSVPPANYELGTRGLELLN